MARGLNAEFRSVALRFHEAKRCFELDVEALGETPWRGVSSEPKTGRHNGAIQRGITTGEEERENYAKWEMSL